VSNLTKYGKLFAYFTSIHCVVIQIIKSSNVLFYMQDKSKNKQRLLILFSFCVVKFLF